jgi:putative Holliday junction resolvase
VSRFGRRLAFDYGDVRIGVAVCDPDGVLSTPLTTLNSKDPKVLEHIAAIVDEYEPVKIYIGLPVHLSGSSGTSTVNAKEFGEKITARFDISVAYIDERLSTVSANKKLLESGMNSKQARASIDQSAAVEILEQGLRIDKK